MEILFPDYVVMCSRIAPEVVSLQASPMEIRVIYVDIFAESLINKYGINKTLSLIISPADFSFV